MFPKHQLAPLALMMGGLIFAYTAQDARADEVGKLQDIEVKGVANKRKPNKVQKNSNTINKEQVANIRDLTRYDPGISVVEQGKGATKGYAIYGVDRNRVAINVDGLEQAESFELDRQETSGARLEAEYEHVTQVDVTKGADSVSSGSGALGGAVSLRTKTVKDIVAEGKTFGARYKTGYFSKDRQWLNSFAVAADHEHFDVLLMHTRRNGHEYQANVKNAPGQTFHYRKRVPKPENAHLDDPYLVNGSDPQDGTLYLSPQDIVGEKRLLPDPMTVRSESTLLKAGLKLGERKEHYLGVVGELEKKDFDIHVKSESEYCELKGERVICKGNNPIWSVAAQKFTKEAHQRQRIGLEYVYRPLDAENSWVDRARLALNQQYFRVDLDNSTRNCTPVPFADPNCRPKFLNEKLAENGFDFKQRQTSVGLELDKWFDTKWGEHDIKFNAGISKNNYTINAHNRYYSIEYYSSPSRHQRKNCIHVKNKYGNLVPICELHSVDFNDDGPPIHQRKFYLALSDQIAFNRWLSVDVGARWEVNRFSSEQKLLPFDNYRNSAYRLGLNVHPTDYLTLGYKYATGFRVPSAGEIYGSTSEAEARSKPNPGQFIDLKNKLKPETSQMHELSARLSTSWLNGNLALFTVNYDNLIGRGSRWRNPIPSSGSRSFFDRNYNLQQTRINGASLDLQADLHSIWKKIPNGLSAVFSVTAVKQASSKVPDAAVYSDYMTYPLDSLQPLKIVYGFDYTAPSGKWGLSHRVIYSKGKSEKELLTEGKYSGNTTVKDKAVGRYLSKKWSTVDVFGYWKPSKNLTVNAGVYNLFNYQYTTWESARRTVNSSDRSSAGKVLLAPGRSFAVSAELKF